MAGELFGDYSRMPTIGPHVRSVLAQQGRVVLDSDVNAQTALVLQQVRTALGDIVGPFGGPSAATGFRISAVVEDGSLVLRAHPAELPGDATMPGRYYVDGILCQIDAETTFHDQPHAILDAEVDELPDAPFLVYLKVWERTITAIEDPSTREVALGPNGPDTTTRNQVVWQLLVSPDVFGSVTSGLGGISKADLMTKWQAWAAERDAGRATLRARAIRPPDSDDEPCPTPPSSAYRGLENQLYRVEIHHVDRDNAGKVTAASFKWSRDNGSATYPLESLAGEVATVTTLGRDRGSMLDVGDWVEVVDDRYALHPGEGPFGRKTTALLRVMDVEPLDRTVRLSKPPEGIDLSAGRHPFLRRWDQQTRPGGPKVSEPGNALEVTFEDANGEDQWVPLEDGIEVAFQLGNLRVGDYWLIPARTETGDIEWPGAVRAPDAIPPMGVDYAFAPLALVRTAGTVVDLRMAFDPISKAI